MSIIHNQLAQPLGCQPIPKASEADTAPDIQLSIGEPTLVMPKPRVNRRYEIIKRGLDLLIALSLLVLLSPVILLCCLLVRLTSRGPAIYTQVRLGKHRKPYVIFKMRSMYHDCERYSGIRWSSRGDNRITWFGHFLRKTHIDELPQLWNVVKGEMSLIGPRPERPELVSSLQNLLPEYLDRLLVNPGLTGLAQIQLPPDADLESVRRKLQVDLVYINDLTFWLDCRLFVGTLLYLVGVPQWKIRNKLHLPFPVQLQNTPKEVIQPSIKPELPAIHNKKRSDSRPMVAS